MKKFIRYLIMLFFSFITLDIVKGILPSTCSLRGHYHIIGYEKTTSNVAQGIRYQSGRPYLNYSGGKKSCPLKFSGTPAGMIVFIYSILIYFSSSILAIPAYGFEILIGAPSLCSMVRILNALCVLFYFVFSILYYYFTDKIVFDLSKTELKFLQDKFLKK